MVFGKVAAEQSEKLAEFRLRNRRYDEVHVTPGAVKDYEADGWVLSKNLKTWVRMRRDRTPGQNLEDRFWCCLYRLGYPELNVGRAFRISIAENLTKQIDVFAKDDETVVIAECKTAEENKRKFLQKHIGEFEANKKAIANAVRSHYGNEFRPKIIWMFVLDKISVSQSDIALAREHKIFLLTDRELTYFEEIGKALGATARQQFKAEYLADIEIPALGNKKIPAVKTKIGGKIAYTFSSKWSDIVRVAFVNHRDLRDPTSAPTYQRLVNPNRLKKIREFLVNGGYFPNSILLNFQRKPRFDVALKSEDKDIQFGYLYLPDRYKSLKVIDGQHRLYGCALLQSSDFQPNLFFVAFEGISGSEEANLFATINREQQKVQPRLLNELDGELKWDSDILRERVQAICSRAIDLLNAKFGSPFEDKVVSPGLDASTERPLTLTEIRKAIISSGVIGRETTKNNWIAGPFYSAKDGQIDNIATLNRLIDGLDWYFSKLRDANEERWQSGNQGRICNNFGIPGHLRLLGELIRYVEHRDNVMASELSLKEIALQVEPFLQPVLSFVLSASHDQFEERFNVKLGSGGVKQYYFALSQSVNEAYPEFRPTGFEQWLATISAEEQERADKDAKWIQSVVHTIVVEKLRKVYGDNFFDLAITNQEIQVFAHKKRLDDPVTVRGWPEKYLDFMELKKIVEQKENWNHFEPMLNIKLLDQQKGLAKYIKWFDEVNRIRRVSAHPYQRTYSQNDLEILQTVVKKLSAYTSNIVRLENAVS